MSTSTMHKPRLTTDVSRTPSTLCFHAGEAAIVSIAEHNGIDTKQHHDLKAGAATQLHGNGVLDRDYGPLLRTLNQARKDIRYDGEEPELDDELELIAARVEELVNAAEAYA